MNVLSLWLAVSTAWAGPVDKSFLQIAPAAEITGDDATSVRLAVMALDDSGAPLDGLSLKATTKGGKTGPIVPATGGNYFFDFTPDAVKAPTEVTIEVKGKTEDKKNVSTKATFTVRPPVRSALKATMTPDRMTADVEPHATVAFAGGDPSAELSVRASSGTLLDTAVFGDGRHKVRWEASDTEGARVVLVTAVDRLGVSDSFAYGTTLQQRLYEYPVAGSGSSDSLVSVKIAEREFGPISVAAGKEETLPIVLPPGEGSLTRYTVSEGNVDEAILDAPWEPERSLLLFPIPQSLPANPSVPIPVRVAVLEFSGAPHTSAKPVFTASSGSFSAPKHLGEGVYEATFTPPGAAGPVTIEVREGGSAVQKDSVQANAVAESLGGVSDNPVDRVVIVPWAPQTRTDGVSQLGVTVVTVDAYGLAVPSQAVSLATTSGSLPETVTTGEDGTIEVFFTSGQEQGLAWLTADADGARGAVGVIQTPGEVQWSAPLPRSGTLPEIQLDALIEKAVLANNPGSE